MREIKFRISYKNGKWYYGMPISQIKNNSVAFNSFDNSYYDLFADATTLGQFTGLKDKNGNEIYENDLCLLDERIGIVAFKDCQFVIIVEDEIYPLAELYSREIELIGNIYDNPELLGGGENE